MGLTTLLAMALLLIILAAISIGMVLAFKRKDVFNKPGIGVSMAIFSQTMILVLLLTGILGEMPVVIFRIWWWGTVLLGFVFGIIDFKKNAIAALIVLVLSCILAVVGFLMLLIVSM